MNEFYKKISYLFISSCFCLICGCSQLDNANDISNQSTQESNEKNVNLSAEELSDENHENNNNSTTTKTVEKDARNETQRTVDAGLFESINADCIFSIGIGCRPSGYLRDLNMRFQAAPLDWVGTDSLYVVAHLFETKFSDFFEEIKECPEESSGKYRCVRDTKNQLSSPHHFKKDASLEEEHKRFRETMLNRANKVDEIFKNSSSIVLIGNRKSTPNEEFINFIKSFSAIYPDKKVTLINIKHSNIRGVQKEILFENETLKVIQYVFDDGPTAKNSSDHWKGNIEVWTSIVTSVNLSDKFATEEMRKKVDF